MNGGDDGTRTRGLCRDSGYRTQIGPRFLVDCQDDGQRAEAVLWDVAGQTAGHWREVRTHHYIKT